MPDRLRHLLSRARGPRQPDLDAELRWWIEVFDDRVRTKGGYYPGDIFELIDGEPAASYEERRWQIARAEVVRVLREAQIDDPSFFEGKVVMDVGPGPLGFPDACPARVRIGIEPLADRYREHGLMLESDAIYLTCGAESLPLTSGSVDVGVARNSLDHVSDPTRTVAEIARVLRPGGVVMASVDIDHPATATEPHTFARDTARALFADLEPIRERIIRQAHGGGGGSRLVVVARKP